MPRRTFTEAVKRQIAARQQWRCSACEMVLPSSFQVDHTKPLWMGGADTPSNSTAMCPTCHSLKTQNEEIERRRRDRERAARLARRKRREAERAARVPVKPGVSECVFCKRHFYSLFKHSCKDPPPTTSTKVELWECFRFDPTIRARPRPRQRGRCSASPSLSTSTASTRSAPARADQPARQPRSDAKRRDRPNPSSTTR